jgi:hypothetical protein
VCCFAHPAGKSGVCICESAQPKILAKERSSDSDDRFVGIVPGKEHADAHGSSHRDVARWRATGSVVSMENGDREPAVTARSEPQ